MLQYYNRTHFDTINMLTDNSDIQYYQEIVIKLTYYNLKIIDL